MKHKHFAWRAVTAFAGTDASATSRMETEATMSASITTPKCSQCRYCGCTDERACRIPLPGAHYSAFPCSWANEEHDVCTAPACIDQWFAERAARAVQEVPERVA